MTAANTWRLIGLEAMAADQNVELSVLQPAMVAPGDTHYDKVWLLLKREGGAFLDQGQQGAAFTVTGALGNADAPTSAHGESGHFSGSKSLSVAQGTWNFPDDFTVELWFKPLSGFNDLQSVIARGTSGSPLGAFTIFRYQGQYQLYWVALNSGSPANFQAGIFGDAPVGVWTHLAFARSEGVIRCWRNGVLVSSVSLAAPVSGPTHQLSSPLVIGGPGFYGLGAADFLINDLRITRGVARYSGQFKPPSSPYAALLSDGSISLHPESIYTISSVQGGEVVEALSTGNSAVVVRLPSTSNGFSLVYEFAEPVVFNAIHVGATTSKVRFLAACTLQYLSANGVWVTAADLGGMPWTGKQGVVTWGQDMPRNPFASLGVSLTGQLGDGGADLQIAGHSTLMADVENGGRGAIYGDVVQYVDENVPPTPLRRRVRLRRSRDGLLVREQWSNDQGQYRFEGLSLRYTYDVEAWDHLGQQQSVVGNDLLPEVLL